MLKLTRNEANWPRSLFESPRAWDESTSKSTMRKRNSRYRTRNCCFSISDLSGLDQVGDVPRDGGSVLLHGQLGEDAFECGQRHQSAQVLDGIVGDHLAAMQNDHVRADTLHGFELVRAEKDDFAARGELLDQAAEHEPGGDVEAG